MKHPEEFSDAAVLRRSQKAAQELAVADRSAKVKRELDNARMDKKERRSLKEFTEFRGEITEISQTLATRVYKARVGKMRLAFQQGKPKEAEVHFNKSQNTAERMSNKPTFDADKAVNDLSEESILEHVGVPAHSMPPNILILRRKTIRQFPNNVMVALYFNDKLGQYFSIPYGGVEADETVITPVALKEEELNEISIATASRAHDERMKRSNIALDVSQRTKSRVTSTSYGKDAVEHYAKALKTREHIKNKLAQADAASRARVADITKRAEETFAKSVSSPRGGASAALQRSQHSRGHLNEWEEGSKHKIGDMVSYGIPTSHVFKRGKITKLGVDHVIVHRKSLSGKSDFHYKVPHDAIVHNERLSTERVDSLNEISIPVATRAYHGRQQRGLDAMKKGDYSTALPHFKKSLNTMRLRSKKYEREDKGETVKEEVVQEDAISHLQKVKAFQTDKPLYHKDGSQTRIDPTTAHALLSVHDALHPDNRKKFADALEHSKGKFNRMLDFSWKNVK